MFKPGKFHHPEGVVCMLHPHIVSGRQMGRTGSTAGLVRPIVGLAVALSAAPVYAAGTGMPWEGPLDQLLASLTGNVAHAVGAIAIIALGFGVAFSEGGGVMRKALWVVLGLAVAFSALSWGLPFLGFAGGLTV